MKTVGFSWERKCKSTWRIMTVRVRNQENRNRVDAGMSLNSHGWHGAVPLKQVQRWQESCSVPLPNKVPGENHSKHPPFKSWIKGFKNNGHNKLLVVVMLFLLKLFKPYGKQYSCQLLSCYWGGLRKEHAYPEPTNQSSLYHVFIPFI